MFVFSAALISFLLLNSCFCEATDVIDPCRQNFTFMPSTRRCYKVITSQDSWRGALGNCTNTIYGARLAVITSEEENRAVKAFLVNEVSGTSSLTACIPDAGEGYKFWIGAEVLAESNCYNPFVWRIPNPDPETGEIAKVEAFDFSYWAPGEPNCATDENFCLVIQAYNNFRWADYPCTRRTCALCEYNPRHT